MEQSSLALLCVPVYYWYFQWYIQVLPNPVTLYIIGTFQWSYLQTQYKKLFTLLKHSKQDPASVAPLHKHKSVHQDDSTKATILNEQLQSVLVGSLLTASAPFVTWNYKNVLMQTDPC